MALPELAARAAASSGNRAVPRVRNNSREDDFSTIASDPMKTLVWRQRAACRGVEPDIFYPLTDEDAVAAKSVCAQCSVRQACLEYALTHREKEGVWGGATERERRRILRQRRRSA
jgi:WhiB family redox-sensing transcriptional regulator